MDKLWAPWRIKYIINHKKQRVCLFCAASKSADDSKGFLLYRSKSSICMLNIYPYNAGHLMAAPKRHVNNMALLNEGELLDLWQCVIRMQKLLDKTIKPQGYNIGINLGRPAGAGVAGHIHIHIVPRWNGDTNFMPVTAGAKVLPESLESLYNRLKNSIKRAR